MERKLLESRQLTPAITDRQLIKKIARHFGKNIEIAVVTRGINSIQNLESLIAEYATINQRTTRDNDFVASHEKVNARGVGEATNTPQPFHNKGVSWKQKQHVPNKESESGHNVKGFGRHTNRQPINSLEFVNNGASTLSLIHI